MRISDWSSDVCSSDLRDWKMYGDPKTCSHQVSLGYDDDRLRVTAARSCFGSPAHVRVGVRMADNHDGSHPVSDWLIGWKQIGRASCRERGCQYGEILGVGASLKKKKNKAHT